MSNIIDARGRSCPKPVIMTKNALESANEELKILVDSHIAVENITRFVKGKGYNIDVIQKNLDYEINIKSR